MTETQARPETFAGMRRFFLDNKQPLLPKLGFTFAQGVVWSDGSVSINLLDQKQRETPVATWISLSAMESDTWLGKLYAPFEIRFLDPICFQCGSTLEVGFYIRHCYDCGAGQGDKPFNERRPNPSLGQWAPALVIPSKKEGD